MVIVKRNKKVKNGPRRRRPGIKNTRSAQVMRSLRRSIPLTVNKTLAQIRGRTETFTASEICEKLLITSSTTAGRVLLDMFVSPRLIRAPLLNHRSQAWTNYRFTKLSFEFVSFFPTNATGGITYGLTRDVDEEIENYTDFTTSCEATTTSSLSASRTKITISCSPNLNKQRFFSTLSSEPSDFAQFRLLSVLAQQVSGITSTGVAIDVIMHYTVEFSGPVAPNLAMLELTPTKVLPEGLAVTVTPQGVLDPSSFSALSLKTGAVYAVNPALVASGLAPIRAISPANPGNAYYCYPTIDSAMANSGVVIPGSSDQNYLTISRTMLIPVSVRGSTILPTLLKAPGVQELQDKLDKFLSLNAHEDLTLKLQPTTVVANVATPAAEGDANTGPVTINVNVPSQTNVPAHA